MNDGVRILLERMETHPQEFNNGIHQKWGEIISDVVQRARGMANPIPFLNDDEVRALYDKLTDLERNEFTAKVLRTLADTPEELEQFNLPYMPAIPRRTYGLSLEELKQANSLGVSPEVFAETKLKIEEKKHRHILNQVFKKRNNP